METERTSRRGFLKGLVALAAGASTITATPAEAQPYRRGRRRGYRRAWRMPGYYGGYRGLETGYYGTGYYSSGYSGLPYVGPRVVAPVRPFYSAPYVYPPMM